MLPGAGQGVIGGGKPKPGGGLLPGGGPPIGGWSEASGVGFLND
jgi:hypothetical protein